MLHCQFRSISEKQERTVIAELQISEGVSKTLRKTNLLWFASFPRWEVLGESPLCFQLWKIQEEGKLKQEAILEAKSDLTEELRADGCQ